MSQNHVNGAGIDGLFSAVELAAGSPEAKPGFRLARLEVLNWGTFDGRVSRLDLDGETTLLTGDIGSGKSTLVDAVTTLLLPANRINYNKAAGAEGRERDLRSYVQGYYKSERVESTGGSRAVGLRDHRQHTVILGVFANAGYAAEVTLAQVFWTRDTNAQPNRFFVTADRGLSIAEDFTDFGSEVATLKRRLRASGAEVADHFPDYGVRLRRLLGIHSEQALELLHQTISMKSVGNLTDFVRQHMLEGADAGERIAALVAHFDNLTRAHDAVRRAKDQLAGLDPIVALCDTHAGLQDQMDRTARARTALRFWIADRKSELLTARRVGIEAEIETVEDGRRQVGEIVARLQAEQRRLELAREGAGGSRLAELTRLVDDERSRRAERETKAAQHAALLSEAGLSAVTDADGFARARTEAQDRLQALAEEAQEVEGRRTELAVDQRRVKDESDALGAELRSLRGRESNIDARNLAIRDALRTALGLAETDLPFAGELIQVRAEHGEWQGAAERVLRGFALSVLVPAEHYDAASAWVDANHLGGRLVYYRVPPRFTRDSRPLQSHRVLADLLDVKPGPFAEWVTRELGRRADHACAESVAELRTHQRAVTRAGQVKSGDGRHEKDDRFRIDDRTRWVLGWSNEDKIDALLEKARGVQQRLTELAAQIESSTRLTRKLAALRSVLDRLSVFTAWTELDWRACVAAITRYEAEREQIERGNAELARLGQRLAETAGELTAAVGRERELTERRGELRAELTAVGEQLAQAASVRADAGEAAWAAAQAAYELVEESCPTPRSVADCDRIEREQQAALTERIEKAARQQQSVGQRAVAAMQEFRRLWPAETTEMDADVAAAAEYRALRERLASDDLPRFEAEFKRQLNTNTINDIAGFSAWLGKSATVIRERIDIINDSLRAIEYNTGTLITLTVQPSGNQEIRTFREELRACTDEVIAADDQYSEERFLRVKRIIERFKGREGQTELDRRWTALVTDVRNWFAFAASERWIDSGEEREHYADSDGKSGGQKEKLAYTILAASLAYQYRLEWGVASSRDFRFALIDEAFGRGSDASTRYALDLFRKLGLQLLVVTPLQKVHIIEPFVAAVGFVENRTGAASRLQTLTIEDYHALRAERTVAAAVAELRR